MTASKTEVAKVAVILLAIKEARKTRRKRKRRWSTRPAFQLRMQHSEYIHLIPHLESNDPEMYFSYHRMTPEKFELLFSKIQHRLHKTSLREPVSPEERLTITLVFLATGCSQQELAFRFHRGRSTISNLLNETCDVIWELLSPSYIRCPESEEEWRDVEAGYRTRWNFPNCVGSLDGKHFRIQCPVRRWKTLGGNPCAAT